MVGSNCAFYGCSSSRKHEYALFKIPVVGAADGEETAAKKRNAREEWLRLILRTREKTAELAKQIERNNVFICARHFKAECILTYTKRKVLVTGSVPTDNLPTKSHEVPKHERRILVRADIGASTSTSSTTEPSTSTATVSSIEELMTDLERVLVFGPWTVEKTQENEVSIKLFDESYSIPKYTVLVDSGLQCSVFVYQWPIPEDHVVYKQISRSVRHGNIHELLQLLESSSLCGGLPDIEEVKDVVIDPTTQDQLPGTIIRHSVPKQATIEEPNFEVFVSLRSVDCRVLKETAHDQKNSCQPCATALNAIKRANRRKSKASAVPAKPKASLAACGTEKLRATVQVTRLQCTSKPR